LFPRTNSCHNGADVVGISVYAWHSEIRRMPPMAPLLNTKEEKTLLSIARDSLERYVRSGEIVAVERYPLTPRLCEPHAAFVTLREGTELRGCIGYTRNLKPLAETVRDNAVNAAVRDPRFPPVTPAELDAISIEISVLYPGASPDTPFIPVRNLTEIEIGRDGLYFENPELNAGGLLLPQVAVEHHWTVPEFLRAVCRKAGAPEDAWQWPGSRLYRFSAQIFSE
jgi:AmmeMemoRadiSam system protein A